MERDFVGHGPDAPLAAWPDGSLVAVNIVVNVEEGAEAAWPDGEGNDAWGEYAIPVAPAIRDLGTEGHFEFGSRVGIWRLVRLLERFDAPATFGVCARALERNPPFADWLRASTHDVIGHGYRWAEVTRMSEDEERADLEHAMRVLPALVGRPVRGWYVRSFPSERTRRLAPPPPTPPCHIVAPRRAPSLRRAGSSPRRRRSTMTPGPSSPRRTRRRATSRRR